MQAVIILAVVFVAATSINGFEMEMKCKGIDLKVPDEHKNDIIDCAKASGVSKLADVGMENAGCLSKCIMVKKGFVDEAGQPHKENIMKAIDEHLPEALKAGWKTGLEACLDVEGKEIKATDDPNCMSYLPLSMCTYMVFIKVCE